MTGSSTRKKQAIAKTKLEQMLTHHCLSIGQVEIAKSFDVPYEPDLTLIHKNSCPNATNDLISFNTLSEPPMPPLPQEFNDTGPVWNHGEVTDKTPYPSDIYPNVSDQPPPLPSQPPAAGPNLKDAQPPPYDMNVFPDQVKIENKIRSDEDSDVKKPLPNFDANSPDSASSPPYPDLNARTTDEPSNPQDNETGVDLDELTRRFNDLKK